MKVEIGDATLYCGDAIEILKTIEVKIGGLVTDPPYSSGGFTRGDRMKSAPEKYLNRVGVDFFGDNRDVRSWAWWLNHVLTLSHDIMIDNAYSLVFSDWRQLPTLTDVFQSAGFVWRGVIPWNKTLSSRAPHTGYYRHQCEYVVWGSKGALNKSAGGPYPGCFECRVNPAEKQHITGKPVNLMIELMKPIQKDSIVLDPFMGSGTTGVAAIRNGQKFIGIEKSLHCFNVAVERLKKELDS